MIQRLLSFPTLRGGLALLVLAACATTIGATSPPAPNDPINEAREALRKRDAKRLAQLRNSTRAESHPLAMWVDYWELGNRITEARTEEAEAFYTRWAGTYVEDRFRNDWLLELGRRRDWAAFARDYPRFRMNDDREVSCYWQLTEHLAGKPVRETARELWFGQRDADDGCAQLATQLVEAKVFGPDDVWLKLRLAIEQGRARVARNVAPLLDRHVASDVTELLDHPIRYLRRQGASPSRQQQELITLALLRAATADPEAAAQLMDERWQQALSRDRAAWVWAAIGKQAALKLANEAPGYYKRAWALLPGSPRDAGWTDEMLAWSARSALRAGSNGDRWPLVRRAIEALSDAERRDPTWVYWHARALAATAAEGEAGDEQRAQARERFASIAGPFSFYGKLAAEEIGFMPELPALAPLPSEADRERAATTPGLARALQLITLGLRGEGVREWNFTLRGMGDRELFAAAALACAREVWDRCINTSDRTRADVDLEQRYPMPFRELLLARSREAGLDPAYVYGLIRQESRFISDARSSVGASGLMQLMPGTARWVARKAALDYKPEQIVEPALNVKLGTAYLKLVLEDFGGSQAMAAAAYNAGPSRPRRWREGPAIEPAIWAENIPFNETRDYVKKVLSNAAVYATLLSGRSLSLKAWLGAPIGPRDNSAPAVDVELP